MATNEGLDVKDLNEEVLQSVFEDLLAPLQEYKQFCLEVQEYYRTAAAVTIADNLRWINEKLLNSSNELKAFIGGDQIIGKLTKDGEHALLGSREHTLVMKLLLEESESNANISYLLQLMGTSQLESHNEIKSVQLALMQLVLMRVTKRVETMADRKRAELLASAAMAISGDSFMDTKGYMPWRELLALYSASFCQ